MSRANRKREPEQWPRLVNLGLGVLLAGVVAYQLFAPSFHAPRTPAGTAPANGAPGSPLSALLPGASGPAVPEGKRDPFTPLPPGSTGAPGTQTASGTEGLPDPRLGTEAGNRGRRSGGAEQVWIPPDLRSLPPVASSAGTSIPEADLTAPPVTPTTNGVETDQDSGEEMVMVPTRLLEARGGRSHTARFLYGGETLTRRQGDYLGTYRVERVDTDAIILIDSKKRRVRLLTGESVNGAPTPSASPAPSSPVRAVVPRTPRVATGTPTATQPAAQPQPPAPRPASPTVVERPVPIGAPLPTVKGNGREAGSASGGHPEAPVTNPNSASPKPQTANSAPSEASRAVRTNVPMAPAEGPLPLTRR